MKVTYQSTALTPEQLSAAVSIQIRELNEGFLSSLGPRPLELIFRHAAASRFGLLVVAIESDSGQVIGYVLGATDTAAFYRDFLRRDGLTALRYFLPKLMSWGKIRRAVETLLYPFKNRREGSASPAGSVAAPSAELLDLAVDAAWQGSGVAAGLFRAFAELCGDRGVVQFDIPTSAGLDRAHRFYEKMGAVQASQLQVHKGEAAFVYRYTLPGGDQ